MDAVDSETLHGAVAAQGRFLGDQEERIRRITEQVFQLTSDMA